MKKWLGTFLQGDEGAMLVEYALLLTTIAAACAAVVSALGSAAAPYGPAAAVRCSLPCRVFRLARPEAGNDAEPEKRPRQGQFAVRW